MGSPQRYRNSSRDRSRQLNKHRDRKRSYSSYSRGQSDRKQNRSTHHRKHKRHSRDYSRRRKHSCKSGSRHSRSSSASISSSSSSKHYKFRVGEYLGRKYKVKRLLGDGTFGRVVQACRDRKVYAVKIIKAVSRYIESAKTEKRIVKYINNKDPNDEYGVVRYVQSFDHYRNYCLVFKPLGKSLYNVIKMNDYRGFPMNLVQSFFRQILRTIGFIHNEGYTHTDLKPENVLLETNSFRREKYPSKGEESEWIELPEDDRIRIIDFGGATAEKEHHSRIINTRQYRSPEVIMGCCQWDHVSDVWSIGCIIIELYTGDLYFSTHNDVEHLKMIEKHNERPLPGWMISRSEEYSRYFRNGEMDWPRVSPGKESLKAVDEMLVIEDIMGPHGNLLDLLRRCLQVDPRKRISCKDALKHGFFSISC